MLRRGYIIILLVFSSVGVSAMPMCPRLADGHTNDPDQP
jgi:hypothetical protein